MFYSSSSFFFFVARSPAIEIPMLVIIGATAPIPVFGFVDFLATFFSFSACAGLSGSSFTSGVSGVSGVSGLSSFGA